MTTDKISKTILLLASSFGLVVLGNPSGAASVQNESSRTAKNPAQSRNCDQEIRSRISELSKSLANADAEAEAALWAEDATFVDETGKEWQGRPELKKRFSAIFAETGKQQVELVAGKVKPLSGTVALAEGLVQDGAVPASRFSMVFLKQNGVWLISSATETPLAPKQESAPLHDLNWLIGEWSTERNGNKVNLKYEWMANKNFIHCRYTFNNASEPDKTEVQIIGWDPRVGQIVSWNFDSNGGFGHNIWFKKDNQWLVDATRIGSDGSTSKSTHVISMGDANSFGWQSVARTVDGVALADTARLKVERVVK